MVCRKCGQENVDGRDTCFNCGTPLTEYDSVHQKKSNAGKVIIAIIAVIVVMGILFCTVAGIIIYNIFNNVNEHDRSNVPTVVSQITGNNTSVNNSNNNNNNNNNNNSTGGNQNSVSAVEEVIEDEVESVINEIPKNVVEDLIPAVEPANETSVKKDEFLRRANEIEVYGQNYLDTATNQAEINSQSAIVFDKWDVLLNDVYQYLKTIMPSGEFKQLQSDELQWINEKEAAIERAGKEWEGGSGEPMARNMEGIYYTKDRCYYLISLIN